MQKLTTAEEEIMLILWDLKEAFVKEIVEKKKEDAESRLEEWKAKLKMLRS